MALEDLCLRVVDLVAQDGRFDRSGRTGDPARFWWLSRCQNLSAIGPLPLPRWVPSQRGSPRFGPSRVPPSSRPLGPGVDARVRSLPDHQGEPCHQHVRPLPFRTDSCLISQAADGLPGPPPSTCDSASWRVSDRVTDTLVTGFGGKLRAWRHRSCRFGRVPDPVGGLLTLW